MYLLATAVFWVVVGFFNYVSTNIQVGKLCPEIIFSFWNILQN